MIKQMARFIPISGTSCRSLRKPGKPAATPATSQPTISRTSSRWSRSGSGRQEEPDGASEGVVAMKSGTDDIYRRIPGRSDSGAYVRHSCLTRSARNGRPTSASPSTPDLSCKESARFFTCSGRHANILHISKGGGFFISDWLRTHNTVELRDTGAPVFNPAFNNGEFATISVHPHNHRFNAVEFDGIRLHPHCCEPTDNDASVGQPFLADTHSGSGQAGMPDILDARRVALCGVDRERQGIFTFRERMKSR